MRTPIGVIGVGVVASLSLLFLMTACGSGPQSTDSSTAVFKDFGSLSAPYQSSQSGAPQRHNFLFARIVGRGNLVGKKIEVSKAEHPIAKGETPTQMWLVPTEINGKKVCPLKAVSAVSYGPIKCRRARPLDNASFTIGRGDAWNVVLAWWLPEYTSKAKPGQGEGSKTFGPWRVAGASVRYTLDGQSYIDNINSDATVEKVKITKPFTVNDPSYKFP